MEHLGPTTVLTLERTGLDLTGIPDRNSYLVQLIRNYKQMAADLGCAAYDLERELLSHMQSEGATRLNTDVADVRMQRGWEWDDERLIPLLKILNEEQVGKVYTPATTKTTGVPAKWDKRQLNSLVKLGGEIGQCIDAAKWPKAPSLRIKFK